MSNIGQRIKGKAEAMSGSILKIVGKVAGSGKLQSQGEAREIEGEARQAVAKAGERLKGAARKMQGVVRSGVERVVGNERMPEE